MNFDRTYTYAKTTCKINKINEKTLECTEIS